MIPMLRDGHRARQPSDSSARTQTLPYNRAASAADG